MTTTNNNIHCKRLKIIKLLMTRQLHTVVLPIIIAVSIVISILIILFPITDTRYVLIEKVPLRNELECRTYGDSCWEVSRGLYYEIRKGGTIITPITYYDGDEGDEKYQFRAEYAANDMIIGIIQISSDREQLIAIYDVPSNESWPRLCENEVSGAPEVLEKWTTIFMKLKDSNPEIPIPRYFEKDRID